MVVAPGTADQEAPMQRHTMLARAARLLVMIMGGAGLAALLLLLRRRRRRPDRREEEPGEDIGHGPHVVAVSPPEPVDLGGDIPPRPSVERWEDLSARRRLPVGEYRSAPDLPATEPEEAP
jgi:hypothetical protein